MRTWLCGCTILGVVLLAGSTEASNVLFECGESAGYSYFMPGGPVSDDAAGWSEDSIRGGYFKLVLMPPGKFDVLYKDATGSELSARADGAEVSFFHYVDSTRTTVLVLFYPSTGTVEHFLFKTREDGRVLAVWGTQRAIGPISKGSLFAADCRIPR